MKDMILELQDMRHLDWATGKMIRGTSGCFLKIYEEADNRRIYYKLSNYDSYRGVFGHESVNELIVSRLMDVLGIPHAAYRLVQAQVLIDGKESETWLSVTDDFRTEKEEKMPYDLFYELQKEEEESTLDFAIRNGWELYIYQMFLIDYLAANRDRHGSNIEVVRKEEDDSVRFAPLFDQGVSLLFSTYGDEKALEKIDVMHDFPANNYIGTRSLEYNLSLIPKDFDLKINSLKKEDKDVILHDIDKIFSTKYIDKIWELIWKRWCYFEEIRNQKK